MLCNKNVITNVQNTSEVKLAWDRLVSIPSHITRERGGREGGRREKERERER